MHIKNNERTCINKLGTKLQFEMVTLKEFQSLPNKEYRGMMIIQNEINIKREKAKKKKQKSKPKSKKELESECKAQILWTKSHIPKWEFWVNKYKR